ncbi:MAG TPA: CAP domain-containing protein [Gemmatimonadaceae bacterium]|nr:CAP domain-containing protein [Gemmatimonadaceae bacterium]
MRLPSLRGAIELAVPLVCAGLAACEVIPTSPTASEAPNTPVSATSPAVGSAATISSVISLTNQARAASGAKPLTENASLDRAAAILCSEIAQTAVWSHTQTGTAYPQMQDRANAVGYVWRALGENLAGSNTPDAQHVMDMWMSSPDHRSNILNVAYTEIGVAQLQAGSLVCSVQVFGSRS